MGHLVNQLEKASENRESFQYFEDDFQSFLKDVQSRTSHVSQAFNISELDSMRDDILDVKEYLESFAAGRPVSMFKAKMNGALAAVGLKKVVERQTAIAKRAAAEGTSVQDILDDMFTVFEQKQVRLLEIYELADELRQDLRRQEAELSEYIDRLDQTVKDAEDPVIRMRSLRLSSLAKAVEINVKEKIYNKLDYIQSFLEQLMNNLSSMLPVIQAQLSDEVTITGALNSIRDTAKMMASLVDMYNQISKTNSEVIESAILEVSESMTASGLDISYLEGAQERNERFHAKMLESQRRFIEKTVRDYKRLDSMSQKNRATIRHSQQKTRELLEERIEMMTHTSKNT